jgi:hypothetical protein
MKRSSPAGGRLDGLVSHSDSEDDFFERDEDSGDDGAPEEVVRSRESRGSGGGPSSTKKPRRDKHAPAEVSSKKRPPRFQTVVPVPKVVRRGSAPLLNDLLFWRDLSRVVQILGSRRHLGDTVQVTFVTCISFWITRPLGSLQKKLQPRSG